MVGELAPHDVACRQAHQFAEGTETLAALIEEECYEPVLTGQSRDVVRRNLSGVSILLLKSSFYPLCILTLVVPPGRSSRDFALVIASARSLEERTGRVVV